MLDTKARRGVGESEGQLKKRAVEKYQAPVDSTVVINASELLNWKSLMSAVDLGKNRSSAAAEERQRLQAAAGERKARMMKLDDERKAQGTIKPLEEVTEELNRKETVSKAQMKLDEELDEVKAMNKLMLYTKCVTIRDAQAHEKHAIAYDKAEEEKRLDIMMETERIKALKMYEEREHKRIEDRKRGAAVIRAQIEEREQERLRRLELKQQEQEAMLRHTEKMKEDDRKETVKKKEIAKKLMEDVALANAEQIRLKNRQREVEQAEDRRIAEYLREKDQREQEIQAEHERVRAEKEREIARLRSLQEKAQDKQAELDALRARRAQEAAEREHRQKEKEAAARAAAINQDLALARRSQKLEKEVLLSEQARLENEDFERIISVQREWDHQEQGKKEVDHKRRLKNAEDLRAQIAQMEETRKKDRRGFLEEGNRLKAQRAEQEAKIESIRQRKIGELKTCAVPEKYYSELLKKKNMEPLRPTK
ncbi:Cilia- and flagella-associated protein 45 [Diplonema papillatum]|nr:Cilia- and flagella-associated protein 45 [Diplonema papillatum]